MTSEGKEFFPKDLFLTDGSFDVMHTPPLVQVRTTRGHASLLCTDVAWGATVHS